ncbi:toll/interleukin-1 receptor domain-containing protein [uncultured Rheinheimera sp.]|uniref:toll/interleukin-1 receptor domain-containing protein n=1 Tax=uncultured Rheinheimera sp. TaxID=400532 RepID=UPI00259AD137|nr:toll/interleukin-1 receptor domain-containing protein [uncultured Rheinheimera sp.]
MAKIFVSYSHADKEFVSNVCKGLRENGHDITVDVDAIHPGQNIRESLDSGMKRSEVFITFISESSVKSPNVLGEIGVARAYSSDSDKVLFIPILISQVSVPPSISNVMYLDGSSRNIPEVIAQIEAAIAAFIRRRTERQEKESAVSARIESNAPAYIDEAIAALKVLESRNRRYGNWWYALGFISLVLGVLFATYGIVSAVGNDDIVWVKFAVEFLKSVVIVGLLGACSKYAFTLGKAYSAEALKSSDRMHAISFGRFYLKVYGESAKWPELKEVFQHWNIDRSSSFSAMNSSDVDANVLNTIVDVIKALDRREDNASVKR